MQLCHVSHQFIMTSKDNFEIQRSEHFFFQKVKITLMEQAMPHRGKTFLILGSEIFSY